MVQQLVRDVRRHATVSEVRHPCPAEVVEAPVAQIVVSSLQRLDKPLLGQAERCQVTVASRREHVRVAGDDELPGDDLTSGVGQVNDVSAPVLCPLAW